MSEHEKNQMIGAADDSPLDSAEQALVAALRMPAAVDGAAFDARVMDSVRAEPLHGARASGNRRRRIAALSVACTALAAAIAFFVAQGLNRRDASTIAQRASVAATVSPASNTSARGTQAARTVTFTLVAAGASRVAVAGSFNGWNTASTPLHRVGKDTWAAEIPLGTGRYVYQFVIDGTRWVADPRAPRDAGDDFGASNSVVTVAGGSA